MSGRLNADRIKCSEAHFQVAGLLLACVLQQQFNTVCCSLNFHDASWFFFFFADRCLLAALLLGLYLKLLCFSCVISKRNKKTKTVCTFFKKRKKRKNFDQQFSQDRCISALCCGPLSCLCLWLETSGRLMWFCLHNDSVIAFSWMHLWLQLSSCFWCARGKWCWKCQMCNDNKPVIRQWMSFQTLCDFNVFEYLNAFWWGGCKTEEALRRNAEIVARGYQVLS